MNKNVLKFKVEIIALYTLLVVCMGISTIIEKFEGKSFVADNIYGSWWFVGLWAVLAVLSIVCLLRRNVHRRVAVMLLHVSFVVILAGALVTHLTSSEGSVHLRKGETTTFFTDKDDRSQELPFEMTLSDFDIQYYPGTDAVMDYRASVSFEDGNIAEQISVSMNNIGRFDGYRFYQSSYDSDLNGTVLLVAHDPYGIAITYVGYLMLLIGLIWIMCSKHTRIRHLYRLATKPVAFCLLLLSASASGYAKPGLTPVSKEIADGMGEVAVLYNGRICPLNTAATEFVGKLCGSSSWHGYSANEIFMGWMIYYTEWESQPIIKVKNADVQHLLGIDNKWACVSDFYTSDHTYKLSGKANDTSYPESVRKAIREADEKIQVVMMFYNSEMLRLFPLAENGHLKWHTPGSTELPQGVGEAEFQFINHAMDHLVKSTLANDEKGARKIIARIKAYQKEKAQSLMPPVALLKAEILYNTIHSARWVVFMCLTLSFVFCFLTFGHKRRIWIDRIHTLYIIMAFVFVTLFLSLRWFISGHAPMSNGFETMLFMSWIMLAITMALMKRVPVFKALGPVVSALCMLVSMLAGGSPQITQLMPVLQSPLLSVHVALVMMAYSLFAMLTLIAVRCLLLSPQSASDELTRLTALSRLLLYPAVALLAIGIFVGAVWANVSWGSYWSWDPKETWALITLMVYAVPLHDIKSIAKPCRYHSYVLFSFLTILMTYFGVNYFLSGMHSYA